MRGGRAILRGVLLLGLILAGCAHVEAPPGGQEDRDPPLLLEVRPDSFARVAPSREPVVFVFDERLSERGAEDVALVSPRTSAIQVSRRGNELRVGLRNGWEPGQIYQITLRPTLQDLWNNRITEPIQLVFSTGPEIPETWLAGRVVDLITGRPELDARVEAIRQPDSLVYAVPTDSAGNFSLGWIPEGEYLVRAYRDLNRDRSLDPFEPRDSTPASILAADSVQVRLALAMPDTTPPEVAEARVAAGGLVEVDFDDYLDPTQVMAPFQVRVLAADGREVRVARVAVGSFDPAAPGPGDEPAPQPPEGQPPPRVAPVPGEPEGEQRLPSQTLLVELADELTPGVEYRVVVETVRNVVGLTGGGEATFTAPEAPPQPAEPEVPVTSGAPPAGPPGG